MSVFRLRGDEGDEERLPAAAVPLDQWLDGLENEYEVLVQRLRYVDRVLVQHGRKRRYLLPPR